jgi:hypothetical protein
LTAFALLLPILSSNASGALSPEFKGTHIYSKIHDIPGRTLGLALFLFGIGALKMIKRKNHTNRGVV